MKKIYLSFILFLIAICMKATSYTITTVGTSYSPSTMTVNIGDVITIQASGTHPLVQVDQTTWNANGSTAMGGGWGTKTSTYTFTVSSINTIYYVCQNHVSMGMKGSIDVTGTYVKENSSSISQISFFPNPVKEKINVKFNSNQNGKLNIKLYSVCGQEVQSLISDYDYSAGENSLQADISKSLAKGVYFMEMICNTKKSVYKIVID